VPRSLVWTLYTALVLVWSSTWVVIAEGLDDIPPFFGAGLRFSLAGAGVLAVAAATRRPLRTDFGLAALIGLLPFATTYGLIYWAEQYVPSGLTAVLFAFLPLYVALLSVAFLPQEHLSPRLLAGVVISLGGLVVAFGESLHLGSGSKTVPATVAVVLSPLASAIGNVAIKRRGAASDPLVLNGWAMLTGGIVLLVISGFAESWRDAVWSAGAVASVVYLAVLGTGFTFVTLTVLLRELPAMTVSFISLIIPFGALALGAVVRGEEITALAVAGALLVAAGIAVAQLRIRPRARA
jgi:drug/metabolite transporter (DMT)-like permease